MLTHSHFNPYQSKVRLKTCGRCGNPFELLAGNARFCEPCRPLAKAERIAKYHDDERIRYDRQRQLAGDHKQGLAARLWEVLRDPDFEAGFERGARFSEGDVRDMLIPGHFTPGTVLMQINTREVFVVENRRINPADKHHQFLALRGRVPPHQNPISFILKF